MVAAGDLVRSSDPPTYPGCRLRRVAPQAIVTATLTSISWDQEDDDPNGFIAVTSTTITIPTGLGGLYAITCNAVSAVALTGRTLLRLVPTSGVAGLPGTLRVVIPTTEVEGFVAPTIPLLAGDTFAVQVFHSNGVNVNWTAWLSCYRVAKI